MTLATVNCRAQQGIAAPEVQAEVHLAGGLPALSIVGLPETAVKESKDRVRAALQNARFEVPQRRITVSLAPADLPKEGGRYDLPIALGILAASGQIASERLAQHEFLGELSLNGELRAIRGALPAALAAARVKRTLIVPTTNAAEAALVADSRVLAAPNLLAVCQYLRSGQGLAPLSSPTQNDGVRYADLSEVRGQHQARRALEVAAAGGHNIIFCGPPGTGKTMLAMRLPGILPPMDEREAQEAAAVASVSVMGFDPQQWRRRPFRTPHHTASAVALVGGGSHPRPGEISLAHRGILFLDELPEYDRRVLEVLREPMESGRIVISRAARQAEFPASFQLVAAMNPCPCGLHGLPDGRCHCSAQQVARYRRKVSGPLLDRIDIHVQVPRVPPAELAGLQGGEASAPVKQRVVAARRCQMHRQGMPNAQLSSSGIARYARLSSRETSLLETASERLGLSARGYHRTLKLALTIADLKGSPRIGTSDLMEAIQYRRLDRTSAQ